MTRTWMKRWERQIDFVVGFAVLLGLMGLLILMFAL